VDRQKGMAALAALLTSVSLSTTAFAHGAIAIDDDQQTEAQTGYGFAEGRVSPEDAERAAMWDCHEFGNDHCRVAMRFEQCGAYAASAQHQGYGQGSTKAIAMKNALAMCRDKSCNVVIAKCESPVPAGHVAGIASAR
jgi:uncharacterized protein DUF4189